MKKASEYLTEKNEAINKTIDRKRPHGTILPKRTQPCTNDDGKVWVLYYGSYLLTENDLDDNGKART